ncbi:MAG: alkaline phosphatase family protein, partial [Bacillota bacterium]
AGMLRYEEDLGGLYAYNPLVLNNTLGEVVSKAGLSQLRIAETEKYAHVTFFFNGKKEEPFPGEDRYLVPSPKVATYDQKPEMSAFEVTKEAIRRIESEKYDLVILNYANPDMVGHTGCYDAAKQALESVDECLGKLLSSVVSSGGVALVIADHGNVEELAEPIIGDTTAGTGSHTYHTSNKVPCILVAPNKGRDQADTDEAYEIIINGKAVKGLRQGILSDVAPTLLEILGIEKPPEIDRRSLIIYG